MFGKNEIVGKKLFDSAPPESLFVTSMFMTLQGEGPFRGRPAFFIRLAKCNLACSFCFAPSTKVVMGDGKKKKIKDIVVGDVVMSWKGDGFEPKKVVKTFKSKAEKLLKISSNGESIWCTPDHPFLTSNRGWVNAENLVAGDIAVNWDNSEFMKKFNPMFIKENRGRMSQKAKDEASIRLMKLWEDEEFRAKNIERMTGSTNPMKNPEISLKSFINRETQIKSGLETKIEKVCEGLPITFVGSGDLIISNKVPDFVVNGQKKVIEIWAADAPWDKKAPRDDVWIKARRDLFAKEGYETLFLPLIQSELKISEHKKIREKISQFIHNGRVIKSVEAVSEADGRGYARLYGNKNAERVVYNIEVEDNHTYIANGYVVHNCDTYFDGGDWMTFDEIEAKMSASISEYFNDDIPNYALRRDMVLVLTGGEPMLQKNIVSFIETQQERFANVQIESNGTVYQKLPEATTFVVSPKCSEKNGLPVKYLAPNKEVLNRANALKFVMCADQNSPYCEVPEWALDALERCNVEVFVSPMNIYNRQPSASKVIRMHKQGEINLDERSKIDEVISFWEPGLLDMAANQRNHEYTARYCIQKGFTFNMQQHLFASLA